ncbi:unnamed protein product [Macrosiphum euphorbiae]|uniref:Uncharacterized protein n=1 Tax=Macrosiphum euphorbiae TaxID=13131 RepID=A0AAV0VL97_9HEMI|nr:unnamed protein product [Macrosiphum euphorbiae]
MCYRRGKHKRQTPSVAQQHDKHSWIKSIQPYPVTPTHFPDSHNHRPDVLDEALMRIANMQFEIENLNELSSDHNFILLNVYNQSFPQTFKTKQ